MKPRTYPYLLVLGTLLLVVDTAAARSFFGDRVKVSGRWDGGTLVAERIQNRDSSKDPRSGQIEGVVSRTDLRRQSIQIGPLDVTWDNDTRFSGIDPWEIRDGAVLELKVTALGPTRLLATQVEPGDSSMQGPQVEIIGSVAGEQKSENGDLELDVLSMPVLLEARLYNAALLTARQDDKRPADQFTVDLAGRPLVIGGELEARARHRDNYDLERDDTRSRMGLGAQVEFFYPVSARYAAYLEIKAETEVDLRESGGGSFDDVVIRRGESWFYMHDFVFQDVGLQIGRQNFAEKREWWWDTELDAIRLSRIGARTSAEIAVAQDIAPSTWGEPIDPEDEDILRLLARYSWAWLPDHDIDAFLLSQNDRSGQAAVGTRVGEDEADESDARLVWLGGRLSGRFVSDRVGGLYYWADVAYVYGDEFITGYDELGADELLVERHSAVDVDAWGFDAGVSWSLPLTNPLTFTLGYAYGSGDPDPDDDIDRNFRQTGLNDNNGKFRGVDRFRYYGEVLRPELSNMTILTLSLGRDILEGSSFELVYHQYEQDVAADFLRDSGIGADPGGISGDLGQEFDLVIGLEEWKHLELEFVAGFFKPGAAYENAAGSSLLIDFKFNYNF